MKNLLLIYRSIIVLVIILAFNLANAQIRYAPLAVSDFKISVENLTQPTDRAIQFDVYLLDTDAADQLELATIQLGFLFTSDIYTGGTVTASYSNVGSGLIPAQQFAAAASIVSTLAGYPNQTLLRVAGRTPPGAGAGTIISTTGPGTLVTHITLTSTVAFTPSSYLNLIFNSNTVTNPLYGTKVNAYINSTNTPLTVTPGSNALVCCNPVLNSGGCMGSPPMPFAVTGGGSYCQGDAGLPVGVASSEPAVTYTLSPGGAVVSGTGGPITFGNQLAGTYTVIGSKLCADMTILTIPMTGSAVITEATQINLIPSVSNAACGLPNGSIDLTVSGGVPGYSFLWSNGATTEDISSLSAGNYSVTVTDAIGCSKFASIIITDVSTGAASISISASSTSVGTGIEVTYTATPLYGGTPSYQWFVNSLPVGTGLSTYTYVPVNGDQIYVVMTSSLPCVTNNPATSNVILMNVYVPGPSSFTLTMKNLVQTAPDKLEWDVYLLDTDPTEVFEMASIQFGWLFNAGIYTGGTVTGAIDNSTSGLNAAQQLTAAPSIVASVSGYPGKSLFRMASKAPPGAGAGTIISQVPPGTLITHFIMTSTVPFTANSTPDFAFNSNTATSPLYGTKVAQYIASINTQLPVAMGVNAFVPENPVLNLGAAPPVAYTVTGSDSYCTGGTGLPVGLSNSQVGVNYTLIKDGIPLPGVYAGTGSSLSFGIQLFGTYTVSGTADGTVPFITGVTLMNGSAIITEDLVVVASVTIAPDANNVCTGTSITYTASPFGGGSSPTFQWFKNSAPVATGPGYTYVPLNGDMVYVVMTSNSACATGSPVTSNTVTMVVNTRPLPTLSGPANVNVNSTANVYTTEAGMNNYTWIVSAGGVITSGGTPSSNAVTVTWNTGGTQSVSVNYLNASSCAAANPTVYNVTVVDNIGSLLLTVQNLFQSSDRKLEFDIYLLDTDPSQPFELATCQFGFLFNSNIYTGGTITAAINNSNSGLLPAQQITVASILTAVSGYPGVTLLRLPSKAPPGAGNGTIISTAGMGTLVTHITLTSSVSFAFMATANLVFNSSTATSPLYPTKIAQYQGTTNIPLVVTPGVNALVCCNPQINPATGSGTSSIWTGAVNNDWTLAGNWNSSVPTFETTVTIPGGLTNYPTLTAFAACASLTIEDGGSFIGAEFLDHGNAIVKKNIPDIRNHYFGSPIASTISVLNVFPGNPLNIWVREYNPAAASSATAWVYKTNTNPGIVPGRGYTVSSTISTGYTANFSGQLKKVDAVSPTLTTNAFGGFNMLGNPYPSAINWNTVIPFLGPGVSNTVKVWNGTSYNDWNGSVGNNPGMFSGLIPAEQGFFITTTVTGSTITVPLTARTHGNPATYYKEAISHVLYVNVDGNNYQDATAIHFNNDAKAGLDNLDGVKLFGIEDCPQVYTLGADEQFSINELPMAGNETIDLGFKCNADGNYNFTATGMESFDATTPILIEDMKLNTTQDLRANPVYSFNYATGENANRFKLHFKTSHLLSDGVSVFSYDHNIIINNTTSLAGEVWVYDMTGRELNRTAMNSQMTTSIPMQVAIGTYMVKVVTAKASVNQKVFIR